MSLKWKPPKLPDNKTAQYANTADYALIVHEGAVLRGGTRIPGRKFMLNAISGNFGFDDDFKAVEFFSDAYRETGSFARAFRATAQQGQREIKAAFGYKWAWPAGRATKRRNGEVVTSPRNIIDTGELKRSQQPVRFLP